GKCRRGTEQQPSQGKCDPHSHQPDPRDQARTSATAISVADDGANTHLNQVAMAGAESASGRRLRPPAIRTKPFGLRNAAGVPAGLVLVARGLSPGTGVRCNLLQNRVDADGLHAYAPDGAPLEIARAAWRCAGEHTGFAAPWR